MLRPQDTLRTSKILSFKIKRKKKWFSRSQVKKKFQGGRSDQLPQMQLRGSSKMKTRETAIGFSNREIICDPDTSSFSGELREKA